MKRRKRDTEFPENGFEAWGGYMNAKIAKLEEQFQDKAANEEIKKSDLFAGISIFVNGYTKPSANELKNLMAEHGGVYHHYFSTSRTKFIIASNLPDTKVKNLPTTKIIKPEWITDSINANTVLDYRDYLLYTNLTKTQPRLKFADTKNDNTTTPGASHSGETSKSTARTAVNPNFLSEFYNNSRLHHISQLGAAFKEYVNHLRETSDCNFPGKEVLLSSEPKALFAPLKKVIMHIDMDCFFVSVGLRKYPQLRGKPVGVTHAKNTEKQGKSVEDVRAEFDLYNKAKKRGRSLLKDGGTSDDREGNFGSLSEIASCSYEARACGVRNGMFVGPALKLCPDLQTIPYDFEAYKEVAYTLYNTIARYTLNIEAVSCDEMYVDCTELLNEAKLTPLQFATIIRKEIWEKTGCPCSTGFGSNRLQARMATKKAKPNGQYYLLDENVEEYFAPISLSELPGVGRQLQHKLSELGYKTCSCLRLLTLSDIQKHFGIKTGKLLYQYSRGIDERPLNFTIVRKSISTSVNFGIRFEKVEQCDTFLKQLSEEVSQRMKHHNVKAKSVTLKLMVRAEGAPVETAKYMGHGVCDNISKTANLAQYTDNPESIYKEVLSLCSKMNVSVTEMRGIGIQMSKLENVNACKSGGIFNYIKTDAKPTIEQSKSKNDQPEEKLNVETSPAVEPEIKTSIKTTKTLGLSKKRRGRPPKHLESKKPNTHTNAITLETFMDKKTKKTEETNCETIDEDFLNALPDDIQQEIIRSKRFKIAAKITDEVGESKIDPECLAALPEDIRREIETNRKDFENILYTETTHEELSEASEDNEEDITKLDWQQMSAMLKEWTRSVSVPLGNDVEIIKSYMKNLVLNKMITRVHYLMNLLHEQIKKNGNNCIWHTNYLAIIEDIQNTMLMTYGHKLMLKSNFECCKT